MHVRAWRQRFGKSKSVISRGKERQNPCKNYARRNALSHTVIFLKT